MTTRRAEFRLAPYRLVLLDFDGLLVDTERLHMEAYRRACTHFGYQLDWTFETYCLAAHYGSAKLAARIEAANPGLVESAGGWQHVYEAKSAAYLELVRVREPELTAGAEDLLHRLASEDLPHAVVTNSSRVQVDAIRAGRPELSTVPAWITREDYDEAKPAPDGYLAGLRRFGVALAETVAFEDTPRGTRAILAAGCRAVLVTTVPYPEMDELRGRGATVLPSLEAVG